MRRRAGAALRVVDTVCAACRAEARGPQPAPIDAMALDQALFVHFHRRGETRLFAFACVAGTRPFGCSDETATRRNVIAPTLPTLMCAPGDYSGYCGTLP